MTALGWALLWTGITLVSQGVQAGTCVGSMVAPHVEHGFEFTVANVDGGHSSAPEACYNSCQSQILTASSNTSEFHLLTLWDRASTSLATTGFLAAEEPYFINRISMTGEDGNGLGCVAWTHDNGFKYYPLTNPTCQRASKAVCGHWTMNKAESKATNAQQPIPASASVNSDMSKSIDSVPTPGLSTNGSEVTSVPNSSFTIVNFSSPELTRQAAREFCQRRSQRLAHVTTSDYKNVLQHVKDTQAQNAVVIDTWNGDGYGLAGQQCLVLEKTSGIVPGSCSTATAILCQDS